MPCVNMGLSNSKRKYGIYNSTPHIFLNLFKIILQSLIPNFYSNLALKLLHFDPKFFENFKFYTHEITFLPLLKMWDFTQLVWKCRFWPFWLFSFFKIVKIFILSNTHSYSYSNTFKMVNSATTNYHIATVKSHFKFFYLRERLF